MDVIFNKPDLLYFLILIPILLFSHYYILRYSKKKGVPFANYKTISRISEKYIFAQNNLQLLIRLLVIFLIVTGLSQIGVYLDFTGSPSTTHFLIDASDSMFVGGESSSFKKSTDFLNSLPVSSFIKTKKGITTFSTLSLIQLNPTNNYNTFNEKVNTLDKHNIAGTDVGTALANGIAFLQGVISSKKLVVLTDGKGFFGTSSTFVQQVAYDTNTVIDVVYFDLPNTSSVKSTLDSLSKETGGKVYHTDINSYDEIISQINYLDSNNYINLSNFFLIFALLLITLEWLLSKSFFKVVPYD